jgi:hypothetical protein
MEDSWHALSCMQLSGPAITRRHDSIVLLLARFCRLSHTLTTHEPRHLAADSEQRPDLQVDMADGTLFIDVSYAHPTATSSSSRTARHGVDSVGDERERVKLTKYREMARRHEARLHAFVLYSYGGLHRSALEVIRALADALDPATALMSRAEWKSMLLAQIAVTTQRGNAEVMTAAASARHPRTDAARSLRRDPLCRDCECVAADCAGRRPHARHSAPSSPTAEQPQPAAALSAPVLVPAPEADREAVAAATATGAAAPADGAGAAATAAVTLAAAPPLATAAATDARRPTAPKATAAPVLAAGDSGQDLLCELRDLSLVQAAAVTLLDDEQDEAMADVGACADALVMLRDRG